MHFQFGPLFQHGMKTRRKDRWGFGFYGASRGDHIHGGLDIAASPNEVVISPIDGTITREIVVYSDDPYFRGVLLKGADLYSAYEVRLYYVKCFLCGSVKRFCQEGCVN